MKMGVQVLGSGAVDRALEGREVWMAEKRSESERWRWLGNHIVGICIEVGKRRAEMGRMKGVMRGVGVM